MSFLSNILPQDLFGLRMPWAHHEEPPKAPSTQEPSATDRPTSTQEAADDHKQTDDVVTEKEGSTSTTEVSSTNERPQSIEIGLELLATEQSLRLQKKAEKLHAQIKAKHQTVKQLDELNGLLAARAQTRLDGTPNPDGSVDCHEPAIRTLVDTLRKVGITVPLPDGVLAQGERNNVVNALINQRGIVSDEERELAQEFHQCVSEQNSFFQMLMSIADTLHRTYMKMIGTIGGHAAS